MNFEELTVEKMPHVDSDNFLVEDGNATRLQPQLSYTAKLSPVDYLISFAAVRNASCLRRSEALTLCVQPSFGCFSNYNLWSFSLKTDIYPPFVLSLTEEKLQMYSWELDQTRWCIYFHEHYNHTAKCNTATISVVYQRCTNTFVLAVTYLFTTCFTVSY